MTGYSPGIQRQRSCTCAPGLDVAAWWASRRRGFKPQYSDDYFDEDEDDDEYEPSDDRIGRSKGGARWRGIWRRIVREKRRILNSAAPTHPPYDPYTYAQNFDDGAAWVEPENLTRSFSARFAVPSRMLQRVA